MISLKQIRQRILEDKPLQIIGSTSHSMPTHNNTLDMTHYAGIIEHYPEELVINVKAGTRIQDIEKCLSNHNQALPFFTSSNANSTIGGAYAVGNAELRDAVLGVKIIDGRGQILSFGGQIMKNVAGYDVSRLLVGSAGKLAVISEICFKVIPQAYLASIEHVGLQHPIPSPTKTKIEQGLKAVFDPNNLFL
jgi:glycolate oxidase FAD binding subunit